ncbi:type II toxin-antitoxin system HicB family antitoxin [Microcoleus sp. SVA1B1]|uniref:type II toxin-antitoxin system HicB family antitoxin n=2 Tax=Microcoleus TaxID=44471 RepID=UPI002FD36927
MLIAQINKGISIKFIIHKLHLLKEEKLTAMMTYKGYSASIEVDLEAEILFGRVLDINDVVTFKAQTIEEARQEFQNSIDDYLEFCQELGQEPDKPFSGKLPFRTTPEHHRKIFIAAKKAGKSINNWMDEVLIRAAEQAINT